MHAVLKTTTTTKKQQKKNKQTKKKKNKQTKKTKKKTLCDKIQQYAPQNTRSLFKYIQLKQCICKAIG